MNIKRIKFEKHGDYRGQLIALEELINVPFEIKRIYYIFDTIKNVRRGFHAHKELQQILICINGSCKILLDNGNEQRIEELCTPDEGILIAGCVWREMYDFSPNAVLLVLASELYNENDYIRNYDEFKKYYTKKNKFEEL